MTTAVKFNLSKGFLGAARMLKEGEIFVWRDNGDFVEPSIKDCDRIEALEKKGLHVFAVLDSVMEFEGTGVLHMYSYLLDEHVLHYSGSLYYITADVYNESLGIHEMGDIVVDATTLRRVY